MVAADRDVPADEQECWIEVLTKRLPQNTLSFWKG